MENIIKQAALIGLTVFAICFIIYIVVKITTAVVIKDAGSKLKHRQSTIHNIVRDVLPTNEDIIRNIIMNRERSKQKKQSNQKYSQESIKVIVVEDDAYWIQDNTFYQTKVTEDGEIDQSSAKPVDTSNMGVEEIDRLMKIVDDLRGIGKNDGSSSGN
jgi:hypothetical protein